MGREVNNKILTFSPNGGTTPRALIPHYHKISFKKWTKLNNKHARTEHNENSDVRQIRSREKVRAEVKGQKQPDDFEESNGFVYFGVSLSFGPRGIRFNNCSSRS